MTLTGKELLKLAKKLGWKEIRISGSHHHFKKEGLPFLVTIPVHGNKDIPIGLEKKIRHDLGDKTSH